MLYRKTLPAHEWTPPVPLKSQYIMNERQWLLIDNKKERCAFLHIYIACQSSKNDSFLQWNEDLFHLVTQEAIKLRKLGFIVLAMGDFNSRVGSIPGLEGNTPGTNQNTPRFLNFINEVNLVIINTLPMAKGLFTRFMDSSGRPGTKSLIDYGLIDDEHSNTVTTFIIDEEARFDCGSDHALLECIVEFGDQPKVKWSFQEAIQYAIFDNTDYSQYQKHLDSLSSSISLDKFTSLTTDQMLPHISESINKSAMQSFGLKIRKKKRKRKLPRHVILLIKNKNAFARTMIHSQLQLTNPEYERLQHQLDSMKADIKELLAEVHIQHRRKLRVKLLKADPTRKKFWRFLKNQTRIAGNITAAYDITGKMVFEQDEIEEAVLHHFEKIFIGKRIPIYSPAQSPSQAQQSITEIEQLLGQTTTTFQPDHFERKICSPYTFLELEQTLGKLPNGKASGYDQIPNELLKNASFHFKTYILMFLNKILEDGIIPEALNTGKCMLIHKVSKNSFFNNSCPNISNSRVVIPYNLLSTDPSLFHPTFSASSLSGCVAS